MSTLGTNAPHDNATPASSSEYVQFGTREIGWLALGPAIACTALATVAVALRWYTRCRISRCLGLDDYVILFSMVSESRHTSESLANTPR
jgi:hypothetical protein